MKFWTTGRLDERIDFEIFQPVMLEIETRINNIIEGKNYGDEILSYDIVVNIFENKSEERFRYSLKKNKHLTKFKFDEFRQDISVLIK